MIITSKDNETIKHIRNFEYPSYVSIKKTVRSFKDVSGAYDLVLNNYGPDSFNGSIHIEIPDSYSAGKLDELTRAITKEVYEKLSIKDDPNIISFEKMLGLDVAKEFNETLDGE